MGTKQFYSFAQKKGEVDVWIYAVEIIPAINVLI
jgi:hypothetical protein